MYKVELITRTSTYFNDYSIEMTIRPVALIIAKIVPIHKPGGQSDPSNDRPISLIIYIAKI